MNIKTSKRLRRRPLSEINVVPYIDVMLVLVIILMITAPLLTQGVHVNLPQAAANALPQKSKPIIVSVDRKGDFFLNTSKTPSDPISPQDLMSSVSAQMTDDAAQKKTAEVYVKGDRDADYGKVMAAMVLLQKAGASDVGLITENPEKA